MLCDKKTGKAGVLIEDIAGCGRFQVIVSTCVYFLANSASAFTMLFMSFGNYNPGWRCNDFRNSTALTNGNWSNAVQRQSNGSVDDRFLMEAPLQRNQSDPISTLDLVAENRLGYTTEENCPLFYSCGRVEFEPTTSTIVSEWRLVCGENWISSVIISVQMAGVLVGALVAGHVGDAFGRKVIIYGAVLAMAALNVVSIFSVSWEMFAAIRFVLGFICALVVSLYYVFAAEFVPAKWRSVLQGIPAWSLSGTIFALMCMWLRNWRHVHIVSAIIGVIGFVPVLWIPESLRWLEVKNESDKFKRAAEKIARTNGKMLPPLEDLQAMANSGNHDSSKVKPKKMYNVFHLFKKGYAKYTIILSFPWFVTTGVNFALRFRVKILHGHFYVNLIMSSLVIIPFCVFYIVLPNLLGRKKSALIFCGLAALCLLGAGIMEFVTTSEFVKGIGIPALVFTGKVLLDGVWSVLAIYSMELYPTVVRGLGMSWGNTMARLGGVVSPFLVPNTADTASYSYTAMAIVVFVCCGLFLKLPETRGVPLKDVLKEVKVDDVTVNENDKNDDNCRAL